MAASVEVDDSSQVSLQAARAGELARTQTQRCAHSTLRVLMYHRIGRAEDSPELNPVTLSATPEGFERQMAMVVRRYTVVGIDEVIASVTEARPLPPRAVLITFDDAYDCFARHAWPVLRKYGAAATMFVPTAFPDSQREFWWDAVHRILDASAEVGRLATPAGEFDTGTVESRRRANHRLAEWAARTPFDAVEAWLESQREAWGLSRLAAPVMSWDAIRELAAEGAAFAPHSRTHPPLTCVSPSRLRDEIVGSISDLKTQLLNPAPAFAYPGGFVSPRIVNETAAAGCLVGLSTRRGAERIRTCDPLLIRRINVGRRATPFKLRLQLALPPLLLNRLCCLLGCP